MWLFLTFHTASNCLNNAGFLCFKASFSHLEPFTNTSSFLLSSWLLLDSAPLYRWIVVSPQGQSLTQLIYASIAILKFCFNLSCFIAPLSGSKQEPASVDGIYVLEWPKAKQPF